jgi:hypothetical protein
MSNFTDTLINDYTQSQPKRDTNFESAEFNKILDCINAVLKNNNKQLTLSYRSASINRSKYDIGKFGNKSLWRVTSEMFPELAGYDLCQQLKRTLENHFKKYVEEKTIVVGPYKRDNTWHTSIKILVGSLDDNTFTRNDLLTYGLDNEVTTRLNNLETRTFRGEGDTRTQEKRWLDFKTAMLYEDELPKLSLVDISNLKLRHNNEVFTIDPDYSTDFIGTVRGQANLKIEGKSTYDHFQYVNSPKGKLAYADYFTKLVNKKRELGGIGSIHDADYVLFVNKTLGTIVCINAKNFADSWLAGRIDLSKLK